MRREHWISIVLAIVPECHFILVSEKILYYVSVSRKSIGLICMSRHVTYIGDEYACIEGYKLQLNAFVSTFFYFGFKKSSRETSYKRTP